VTNLAQLTQSRKASRHSSLNMRPHRQVAIQVNSKVADVHRRGNTSLMYGVCACFVAVVQENTTATQPDNLANKETKKDINKEIHRKQYPIPRFIGERVIRRKRLQC